MDGSTPVRPADPVRVRDPRRRATRAALPVLIVAACGATAALVLTGHRLWAGVAVVAGGAGILVTRAQAGSHRDARLLFAVRVLDRVHDASVLAPLAWVGRESDVRMAILALVGLGASFLAGYERARATSLGFRVREPAAYRLVLSGILALGLLTGWVEVSLWVFAGISAAAVAVRTYAVGGQSRRRTARLGAAP